MDPEKNCYFLFINNQFVVDLQTLTLETRSMSEIILNLQFAPSLLFCGSMIIL